MEKGAWLLCRLRLLLQVVMLVRMQLVEWEVWEVAVWCVLCAVVLWPPSGISGRSLCSHREGASGVLCWEFSGGRLVGVSVHRPGIDDSGCILRGSRFHDGSSSSSCLEICLYPWSLCWTFAWIYHSMPPCRPCGPWICSWSLFPHLCSLCCLCFLGRRRSMVV